MNSTECDEPGLGPAPDFPYSIFLPKLADEEMPPIVPGADLFDSDQTHAFRLAHYTINGLGIVVNIIVVVVFFLRFRPFSATILTLMALALADGALLITSGVLTFDEDSKIWALPLQQVHFSHSLLSRERRRIYERIRLSVRRSLDPSVAPTERHNKMRQSSKQKFLTV